MSLQSDRITVKKNNQTHVFFQRCIFIFLKNNIRLTPLNLYWQVEIINNIAVSVYGGRCVYNDPKLVIWSPGYRSRLPLIYRIIIQRPLLVINRGARHDIYVQ